MKFHHPFSRMGPIQRAVDGCCRAGAFDTLRPMPAQETAWNEAVTAATGESSLKIAANEDMALYASGLVRDGGSRGQLLAGIEAQTSQRVGPELSMILQQEQEGPKPTLWSDRDVGVGTPRAIWPTLFGILLSLGGPAIALPDYRHGGDFIFSLGVDVLLAGLLCAAGLLWAIKLERGTERDLPYPAGLYLLYAAWTAFMLMFTFRRVSDGEPLTPAPMTGVVLAILTVMGLIVLYFVRRKARSPELPEDEVSAPAAPNELSAADEGLLERFDEVLATRDDYDRDVFRQEALGGVKILCERGVIDSGDGAWMIRKVLQVRGDSSPIR